MLEVKNVRTESKNSTYEFHSSLDTHKKKRGLLDHEKIGRKYPDWSTERKNTEKRIRDMGCSENISYVCV